MDCQLCGQAIAEVEVSVRIDLSGREGPAVDVVHIHCYVSGMDAELPSNAGFVKAARRRFGPTS